MVGFSRVGWLVPFAYWLVAPPPPCVWSQMAALKLLDMLGQHGQMGCGADGDRIWGHLFEMQFPICAEDVSFDTPPLPSPLRPHQRIALLQGPEGPLAILDPILQAAVPGYTGAAVRRAPLYATVRARAECPSACTRYFIPSEKQKHRAWNSRRHTQI